MKKEMTISVAMATYNGERFLNEQLHSIENQKLLPDEMVICDDGSTDDTEKIVRTFADRSRMSVHYRRNEKNLGYARNFFQAIGMTRGEIIFLSDQDDLWAPEKTAHMAKILRQHPEILVLASSFSLIDEQNHTKRSLEDVARKGVFRISWENFLRHPKYMGMLLAVRREVYEEVLRRELESGAEDEWKKLPHDWRLCEYASERNGFYKTGERLAYYRQHGKNTVGSVLNVDVDILKHRCELVKNELQEFTVLEKTLRCRNETDEERMRYLRRMIRFCEKRYRLLSEEHFLRLAFWNYGHLRFISFRAATGDLFVLMRKKRA